MRLLDAISVSSIVLDAISMLLEAAMRVTCPIIPSTGIRRLALSFTEFASVNAVRFFIAPAAEFIFALRYRRLLRRTPAPESWSLRGAPRPVWLELKDGRPAADEDPRRRLVVVFIHGGGFCTHTPSEYLFAAELLPRLASKGVRCAVLALDYSLCPQAAVKDQANELLHSWLHLCGTATDGGEAEAKGGGGEGGGAGCLSASCTVVLAGDSAGAHLALALVADLMLRRQRQASHQTGDASGGDAGSGGNGNGNGGGGSVALLPAALVCISPWIFVDDALSAPFSLALRLGSWRRRFRSWAHGLGRDLLCPGFLRCCAAAVAHAAAGPPPVAADGKAGGRALSKASSLGAVTIDDAGRLWRVCPPVSPKEAGVGGSPDGGPHRPSRDGCPPRGQGRGAPCRAVPALSSPEWPPTLVTYGASELLAPDALALIDALAGGRGGGRRRGGGGGGGGGRGGGGGGGGGEGRGGACNGSKEAFPAFTAFTAGSQLLPCDGQSSSRHFALSDSHGVHDWPLLPALDSPRGLGAAKGMDAIAAFIATATTAEPPPPPWAKAEAALRRWRRHGKWQGFYDGTHAPHLLARAESAECGEKALDLLPWRSKAPASHLLHFAAAVAARARPPSALAPSAATTGRATEASRTACDDGGVGGGQGAAAWLNPVLRDGQCALSFGVCMRRCLEMGCGTGENVAFLAHSFPSFASSLCAGNIVAVEVVVGLDLVPAALRHARNLCRRIEATAAEKAPALPSSSSSSSSSGGCRIGFACADLLDEDGQRLRRTVAQAAASGTNATAQELTELTEFTEFDFIVDCQTFHCLWETERADLAAAAKKPSRAAKVYESFLAPGGHLLLLCGSTLEETERGPVRMTRNQVLHAFDGTALECLLLAKTRFDPTEAYRHQPFPESPLAWVSLWRRGRAVEVP